ASRGAIAGEGISLPPSITLQQLGNCFIIVPNRTISGAKNAVAGDFHVITIEMLGENIRCLSEI
ncbi:hypothetical protein ACJX0J_031361, partial [Zea mays]